MTTAAAAMGGVTLSSPTASAAQSSHGVSAEEVIAQFKGLPGEIAIKILAPAVKGKPALAMVKDALSSSAA